MDGGSVTTSIERQVGALAEIQRRSSRLRKWIVPASGMHHVHVLLDPERGAAVFKALDAEVRAARHG